MSYSLARPGLIHAHAHVSRSGSAISSGAAWVRADGLSRRRPPPIEREFCAPGTAFLSRILHREMAPKDDIPRADVPQGQAQASCFVWASEVRRQLGSWSAPVF